MYFPILRAKKNELLALRDCKQDLHNSKKIIPIIEPVKPSTKDIDRCVSELREAHADHIIVCNPSCGYFTSQRRQINEIISGYASQNTGFTQFAYWLDQGTTQKEVHEFISLIGNGKFYFLHGSHYAEPMELLKLSSNTNFQANIFSTEGTGLRYRRQFNDFNSILIRDNLSRMERNADYMQVLDEFFSDQHLTFEEEKLYGFGDYSIIGSNFFETNFARAFTIAIHLLYEDINTKEVRVRHLLSSVNTTQPPPSTPVLVSEAVEEVVDFLDQNPHIESYSSVTDEFRKLHDSGRSTTSGYIKKLCLIHHLELMIHLLSR